MSVGGKPGAGRGSVHGDSSGKPWVLLGVSRTLCSFLPTDNFRYTCDICGKKYKYYSCFQEHRDLHAVDGECRCLGRLARRGGSPFLQNAKQELSQPSFPPSERNCREILMAKLKQQLIRTSQDFHLTLVFPENLEFKPNMA